MKTGEDELLARICSNGSTRSLALAAVTGMYGAGKYGKRIGDCFWDRAASRTHEQRERGLGKRGRISLSITHAVGGEAVDMINALGWGDLVDARDGLEEDHWDFEVDTWEGWNKYGARLVTAFDELAENRPAGLYQVAVDAYYSLDKAWKMVVASENPAAISLGVVVVLSRMLNSYGKFAYWEKYPTLMDYLRGPSPLADLLQWYASKGGTKKRRARFMEALVWPLSECITELGDVGAPEDAEPVSTLRDAQKVLGQLGVYRGVIDGDFGRKSQQALADWAEKRNLNYEDLFVEGKYLLPYARALLSEAKLRTKGDAHGRVA